MTPRPPGPLVDTIWLSEHLDDPDVVLLQVDVDSSAYYDRHIPGAQPLDWIDELHDPVRRGPPGREQLERLLEVRGVGPTSHVVAYASGWPGYAAYTLWLLRWLRHERLSLLDGGLAAWAGDGRPLTAEQPRPRSAAAYRLPDPDDAVRAVREQVVQRYAGPRPGVLVVDCRTPPEFDGHAAHPVDIAVERHRVAGRLPGARNLPSERLLDGDGRLRGAAELRALFADVGLTADADVLAYCRVAERSALVWFALHEVLGHRPVRHYDGGWTEYGSLLDVPVHRETD